MFAKRTVTPGIVLLFSLLLGGCGTPNISIIVTPPITYLAAGQTTQFKATLSSETGLIWLVNDISGGDSMVGVIDAQGNYAAPSNLSGVFTIKAASIRSSSSYGSAKAVVIAPGQVTKTNNPLVAVYTMSVPTSAKVSVEFGTDRFGYVDARYSRRWESREASVAGMRPSTTYHMRAVLQLDGGTEFFDSDHVFTTGAIPTGFQLPQIAVSTPSGLPPRFYRRTAAGRRY